MEPLRSACYAPHSALYLRPDGLVHACCVSGFALGSVTGEDRRSLRDMWDGSVLAAQRRKLEADSFELGCQECGIIESAGGREATVAYHFDRFADGAPHRFPKLLDLALSSRCNLQCVMCNGGLSSAIRTQREGLPPMPDAYDDRFFEELEEFLPHVERLQFKGGEPFIAPENRRIWDFLIEHDLRPEISVTTNGTIFNERVEHYVRELRMHPNVSVDGVDPDTLESIRVGVDAEVLWNNIDRFQVLAEEAGNGMTLSFCLVQSNWREVGPFLVEADRRGLNCNVIFVNQPSRYDLLQLPVPELEAVIAELSGTRPDLATGEARRAWDEVLERLRAHLERPVAIVVRSALPMSTSEQASMRRDLVRRHGGEPLVALANDEEVVADLEVPSWSDWLQPSAFVGEPMDGIAGVIQERVGPLQIEVLPARRPGVEHLAIRVESSQGLHCLELYRFVDRPTGTYRAFVFELDPAPGTVG